jgi:hypothetical protein
MLAFASDSKDSGPNTAPPGPKNNQIARLAAGINDDPRTHVRQHFILAQPREETNAQQLRRNGSNCLLSYSVASNSSLLSVSSVPSLSVNETRFRNAPKQIVCEDLANGYSLVVIELLALTSVMNFHRSESFRNMLFSGSPGTNGRHPAEAICPSRDLPLSRGSLRTGSHPDEMSGGLGVVAAAFPQG